MEALRSAALILPTQPVSMRILDYLLQVLYYSALQYTL